MMSGMTPDKVPGQHFVHIYPGLEADADDGSEAFNI